MQLAGINIEFRMDNRHQLVESLVLAEIFRKFPVIVWETGFTSLSPPPPSPTQTANPAPPLNRPFLWGFSLVSFRSFRLWRHFAVSQPDFSDAQHTIPECRFHFVLKHAIEMNLALERTVEALRKILSGTRSALPVSRPEASTRPQRFRLERPFPSGRAVPPLPRVPCRSRSVRYWASQSGPPSRGRPCVQPTSANTSSKSLFISRWKVVNGSRFSRAGVRA